MAELALEDFGIACGGRWLLRDLWLRTHRTGVLALEGPAEGVAALGHLLARYVAPHLSVWGSISLGGIDLRVSQPAVRVVDDRASGQRVGEVVLAAASPATWLRIHGEGARGPRAYVHAVLAAAQLGELTPEDPCISLSVGRWARLRLALDDLGEAPLVWLDASLLAQAGAERREVLAAVEQVAQRALVLVTGAAVEGLAAETLVLPEVAPARQVASDNPLDAHRLPGFRWIVPGLLAGMARPGTGLPTLEEDLDALVRIGASVVVTLEEEPSHREALLAAGLSAWHLPIVDMRAPSLDEAWNIAARAAARMARGQMVVFHCKGGVGRTGTMLACTLIARGQVAPAALELVRQQNSHYVQSREQLDFLSQFARGAP